MGIWKDIFGRQPRTIRFRIVTLVAIIVFPLVLLFGLVALKFAEAERRLIEHQRLEITNLISSAVDQKISVLVGMLRGLANVNGAHESNFEGLRKQAAELIAKSQIVAIRTFGPDGQYTWSSEASVSDDNLQAVESHLAHRVFQGQHAISNVRGEGLQNATVTLVVPVFKQQTVRFGLAADVKIGFLSQLFSDFGLPPTWPAAVVDRDGNFVARSLDAETKIGQKARPALTAAANRTSPFGVFENVTWEGIPVLNAYRRSEYTDWTTVVAVPEAELSRPIKFAIISSSVGGIAVLFATLVLTWLMAARISEPVRDLSRFARAQSDGGTNIKKPHHIAELEEVRAALEEAMAKNARLAAIVASAGDAIVSINLNGTITTWNEEAERLLGYTAEEIIGKPKTLIVPDEVREEFAEQRAQIMQGQAIRVETIRQTKDGERLHVSLNSAPVRRADGEIIGISSIIHDISERKAAEEHRFFLMREVAHRSKNQLAIIQSIATQTGRSAGSLDEFLVDFRKRLQGIAVSNDLLTNQNWVRAPLQDLVERQIEMLLGEGTDNVEISGPPVAINSTAAEAIGLALHELATNSVKYGALSVPAGKVSVTWELSSNGAASPELKLAWKERGGPPIAEPPKHSGFGTRIIETMVATSVSGQSTLDFRPEGLHWNLQCDLADIS